MPDNTLKIKNIIISAFLVFLAVAAVYSAFWGPAKKFVDSLYTARTISVSAEGKVEISPDMATFNFSVVSEGVKPETLSLENTNKMKAAIDFVKSKGVEEKDIRTTEYSLSPKYEYNEKTRKSSIVGYSLTQTASVKVRDLAKVGEVLGGLPDLGINQIGSVSFAVENQEQYIAQARNDAFEKAKQKASVMAALNGVELDRVINFSEYQQPYYGYSAKSESLGMGGGDAAISVPQIQPGTQELSVQVNITYALK
jgi:hypothetical protein